MTIQKFINEKAESGQYTKNTMYNLLKTLKSAFRYTVRPTEFLKTNPVEYVTLPNINYKRRKNRHPITINEFNHIYNYFKNTDYETMLLIGFHSGVRINECLALPRDSNIDLNHGILKTEHSIYRTIGTKNRYPLEQTKSESSEREIATEPSLINYLKKVNIHTIAMQFYS